VKAEARAGSGEKALVVAAAHGDDQAFQLLIAPYRRGLHLHCYRMLGSMHDADDAVQDTLLRAWQGLGRFQPRPSLSAWLYTIATNVSLTALARQRRRPETPVSDAGEAAWSGELLHLQPYPDRLLDELTAASLGPEARYELRETVELAFVTALQLLPPKQRAALILRDVLGWSAKETAGALADSVAAVESALQRARASLERGRALGARAHTSAGEVSDRDLLRRFMAAWDAVDIDGIVELLARDVLMTMPPEPAYVSGAEAVGEFFATVPAKGQLDEIQLVPTAANRQPALAAYVRNPTDGVYHAYGLMVLALVDGRITGIVGFADASLFAAFDLPLSLNR
jgi:RNA polymerase sigma-70 factor (ECF subfamily)